MVAYRLRIFTLVTIAILISGSTYPANPQPAEFINSFTPSVDTSTEEADGSGILTIPITASPVVIDGKCNDYTDAVIETFNDGNSVSGTVYLMHNGNFLYVCITASLGSNPDRFASLYLDPNGDGSTYIYAQQDDLAFHTSLTGSYSSFHGTGMPAGYMQDAILNPYVSTWAEISDFDGFEYSLDMLGLNFGTDCNLFGLAFYHHWFAFNQDDYGWPSNKWYDQPRTWQLARLGDFRCNELPNGQLAYVYRGTPANATSYYNFLVSAGYSVTLVALSEILTTDFSLFDLILIADDTGSLDIWGTAGQTEAQVAYIMAANKPMIGLGEGGYAFNGQAGLFIGWPQGWHGPQDRMRKSGGPLDTVFFAGVPSSPILTYQEVENSVGIYLGLGYPQDVIPIGLEYPISLEEPIGEHASLILQGCRLFWGNSGNPMNMTNNGKTVFLNGLAYMITLQCSAPPPMQCVFITKTANPSESTPVEPGTVLHYELTVTFFPNERCTAQYATLTDSIPAGTLFIPGSATGGVSPVADGSLIWNIPKSPDPTIIKFSVLVDNSACTMKKISNHATVQIGDATPYLSNILNHQIQCQPIGLPHQQPDFAEEEISINPYPLILGRTSTVQVRISNFTSSNQPVDVDFQSSTDKFGIGLDYMTFDHKTVVIPAHGNVIATGHWSPASSGQWGVQVVVKGPALAEPLVTQSILDVNEVLSPGQADSLNFKVGNPTPDTADIQLVMDNHCPGWRATITNPADGILTGVPPGEVREATLQVTPPRQAYFGSGCHIDVQGWIGDQMIGGIRKLDVPPVHLPQGNQPIWGTPDISFNPDPPVVGSPNQYCVQLQNPLSSTVPVNLVYSIADFGAGLYFSPVGLLDVTLPPFSLDNYCITWIPTAGDTSQRCAQVTLHQATYLDETSQRNVHVINALPSSIGQLAIPFAIGNTDIVTHTVTVTPTVFGLDPSWTVRILPEPPASLKPGEIIKLQLGFENPSQASLNLSVTDLGMINPYGRVEVGILLDDVMVGGFTLELNTITHFLPMIRR